MPIPMLSPEARIAIGIRLARILWALWAVLATLPWLLPTRTIPWASFYQEATAAAVFLPLCLWAFLARPVLSDATPGRGWPVDGAVLFFACLPAIPLLQAAGGLFAVPSEALLVALYLAAMAATVAASQQLERLSPGRLGDALFAGLAIAAGLSVGLALLQWLQLGELSELVAPPTADGRPAANVGQPNNLSTLLAWGLVALWWLHVRQHLSGRQAWLLAAWLLLGIALTQSRTGWLAVTLIAGAAVLGWRVLGTRSQAFGLAALASGFVLVVLLLGLPLTDSAPPAALSLSQQVAPGKRPDIWQMTLLGIAQQPWHGWGWNQNVPVHVALAQHFPTLFVTVGYAHNVVLDLLLWNGLPLGALIMLAAGAWLRQQLHAPLAPERALLLLALAVFGLHAMLELPHAYTYFLLPAAAMVGMLMALRPLPVLATLPRLLALAAVAALGVLLALIFVDYGRIESELLAQRMREARIRTRAPPHTSTVHVLSGLHTTLLTLRTEPRAGLQPEQLEHWRRTVTRYPTPSGLMGYARAAALNGRPADAEWALALVCQLHAPKVCQTAGREWAEQAASQTPLQGVKLPAAATARPVSGAPPLPAVAAEGAARASR